jgi:hypothetical protein
MSRRWAPSGQCHRLVRASIRVFRCHRFEHPVTSLWRRLGTSRMDGRGAGPRHARFDCPMVLTAPAIHRASTPSPRSSPACVSSSSFSTPCDGSGGRAAFPYRDLVVLTAFAIVLGTLVIQGLTLRPLVRALGLVDDEAMEEETRTDHPAEHRGRWRNSQSINDCAMRTDGTGRVQ